MDCIDNCLPLQVGQLHFIGGLSVEDTAEVLNVSPDTVMRDWRLAKLWLEIKNMEQKPMYHDLNQGGAKDIAGHR